MNYPVLHLTTAMNSALQLYADLLLVPDFRYGFLDSEAHARPENVVLQRLNFWMSQHDIKRPSQARNCHAAVPHPLACAPHLPRTQTNFSISTPDSGVTHACPAVSVLLSYVSSLQKFSFGEVGHGSGIAGQPTRRHRPMPQCGPGPISHPL